MSILLESQESSSPIITKAVASSLKNEQYSTYQFSKIQKIGLQLIGNFPQGLAEWIIPRMNKINALDPRALEDLSTQDLASCRLNDYTNLETKFPAITIGVGLGGATAHLSLALGGPFLPQAFVVTLKNGTSKGDVEEYFHNSQGIAKRITEKNHDLMSIQHYDPVHDGWLVKRVNHLRLKLIDLPEQYKDFIRKKLSPGGAIVYLEGKARWKQFRTGPRNVFQVGGWGDISAEEFISGSERLEKYAKKEKLAFSSWHLKDYPIEEGYESEWGSEPGMGERLEEFCRKEGFQYVKISYADPNDFSRLAFHTKSEVLKRKNLNPAGVVIEMFSQFDTTVIENSALLPLWTIFNTKDSLRYLESMVDKFPKNKPVFFSGLSTFSRTPDLAEWKEWQKVLSDFEMINIGARESHFPADTHALLDWRMPLETWQKNNEPIKIQFLPATDLEKISKLI